MQGKEQVGIQKNLSQYKHIEKQHFNSNYLPFKQQTCSGLFSEHFPHYKYNWRRLQFQDHLYQVVPLENRMIEILARNT